VAEQRIAQRATGDTAARLAAFDVTETLPDAELTIDTGAVPPRQAADLINARISSTRE
jgi:guanylate kinase